MQMLTRSEIMNNFWGIVKKPMEISKLIKKREEQGHSKTKKIKKVINKNTEDVYNKIIELTESLIINYQVYSDDLWIDSCSALSRLNRLAGIPNCVVYLGRDGYDIDPIKARNILESAKSGDKEFIKGAKKEIQRKIGPLIELIGSERRAKVSYCRPYDLATCGNDGYIKKDFVKDLLTSGEIRLKNSFGMTILSRELDTKLIAANGRFLDSANQY